jgi:hypothetical protein
MHELLTHLLPAKARQSRDAYAKLLYCTVSTTNFLKTLGENRLCSSRPLFRECLLFSPVVAFVVLGSVCSVPPCRVSRYAGTDVNECVRSRTFPGPGQVAITEPKAALAKAPNYHRNAISDYDLSEGCHGRESERVSRQIMCVHGLQVHPWMYAIPPQHHT